jgi:hypothetical protein
VTAIAPQIPEGQKSSELRGYLARLIGGRDELSGNVDRALRSVREMARIRTALVLRARMAVAGRRPGLPFRRAGDYKRA